MIIKIKEKTYDEQAYNTMIRNHQDLQNRVKKVGGVACIVIAVIPNGLGVVFYPLGLSLLSSNKTTMRGVFNKIYYGVVTKYKTMRWRR